MSNSPSIRPKNKASQSQLAFALSYLEEEHEKLLALAMSLRRHLEPVDPEHPGDDVNLNAWRLAQILEERLEKTEFVNAMRSLVLGEV